MALTTIPAAGAKLRGSVLSSLITEVRPLSAIVGSNQNLTTSSTTLQNITDLVLAVAANASYNFLFIPAYTLSTGTTADVRFGASVPTGATLHFGGTGGTAAGIGAASAVATDVEFVQRLSATSASTVITLGGSTGTVGAVIEFWVITGANAGNLQIMAAQGTSSVDTTTILAGCRISGQRLS
ncbi:MAG TPA: hypothetical protein VF174_08785 [Micromonosporaceae bacterium]